MKARSWALLLLSSHVVLHAAWVRAADRETPKLEMNVDTARSHFQRGVVLYRAGAYDAALAEFSRAYDSAPNYRILYNLGQIHAQRHDYVEALALFRRYLADGSGDVPAARASDVQNEMAELERRISRLVVETNVDGARLFVNDAPATELPREEPLLVNAGIHRLRVEKPGYLPAWRTVTLTGGDELELSFDLVPEVEIDDVVVPAPPPAPSPPEAVVNRTALWASLAATGALTGATVTFGLLTRRANGTLDRQLESFPAPRAAVDHSRHRVRTFALLTDAFGLAAATALGLTTYFYVSPPDSERHSAASGLRAQLGSRSSGLWWTGDF